MRTSLVLLVLCTACSDAGAPALPELPDMAGTSEEVPDAAASPPDMPGTSEVVDPAEPGEHGVRETDASVATALGTAAVTVFEPEAAGTFPLVIVSPGFQIGRGNYEATARHLASWGYVVVTHDYTSGNHDEKAAEIGDLIDWAIARPSVDATLIATAGHSLGGKVSILAAIEDPRIDTVVGWDPVDALPPFGNDGSTSVTPERVDELTKPIAVLGETLDGSCAPAADNYQRYFAAACAAPAALEVTIAQADHTDWVDDRQACGLACFVCASGGTPDATVHTITRRVTTAWLETHLRGRTDLGAHLTQPGAPATTRTDPGC